MTHNAQTFWLDNLEQASHYNRWIFSQIQPFLGREVLEVGCGTGNFSVLMAPCCDRLVAVDLNPDYVQVTQSRLQAWPHAEARTADATQIEPHLGLQRFDSAVLLDILEHIEDDAAALRQMATALKPGGRLIVKVPALESLYSPMDRAIGHYRRYQKRTLAQAFQKAGLAEPDMWFFNLLGIPSWWFSGCLLKKTQPASGQVQSFNKIVPLLEQCEATIPIPVGLSLFAVSQVGRAV